MPGSLRLATAALALALAAAPSIAGTTSARWVRELRDRPVVSQGDVLLAAALITDPDRWCADPVWASNVASRRGSWDGDPADLRLRASRGFASRVFVRLLDIDGGLMMLITGKGERYSYRELVVLGLMPPGGHSVDLTGDELAGLLLDAESHRENGPSRPPTRSDLR